MKLNIDIDGVLLNAGLRLCLYYETDTRADHSVELIDYITKEFDCYWLTTHCKGDVQPAIDHLSNYFPEEAIQKLRTEAQVQNETQGKSTSPLDRGQRQGWQDGGKGIHQAFQQETIPLKATARSTGRGGIFR